ncbi:MAG: flavodoxin family protein [Leptolyngbya sp. SIO4C1]|nr:flavodoxin family protein [Leptolyngbya sp. SIO4C1]
MPTVAVVYFSGQGHTKAMAEAVVEGAAAVSATAAHSLRITGDQIVDGRWQDEEMMAQITAADAIVFGTPTYMGGVAGQYKCFIDAASEVWFQFGWKNKIAGGFTHSSSPSGDKQSTLLYLAVNAYQHSMIWVGPAEMPSQYVGKDDAVNRLGAFMGVMGQSDLDMSGGDIEVHAGDLKTARLYGQRIAEATQRWLKGA